VNSFSGHGFYIIPLAANGAANRLEHFHGIRRLLLTRLRFSMDKTFNSML
jgi:hypothetical protein